MSNKRESILKKLMTNYGLFENMFWKYGDNILYDTDREYAKRLLVMVYKFKNVERLFPEEIDKLDYEKTLKTIFTYYDQQNEWKPSETK